MNYKIVIMVVLVVMGIAAILAGKLSDPQHVKLPDSIYDFKIQSLDGQIIDFTQYKGKNLLIVNTASKCGYTPQYADLQKLHEEYGDQVTVLGFPANNF